MTEVAPAAASVVALVPPNGSATAFTFVIVMVVFNHAAFVNVFGVQQPVVRRIRQLARAVEQHPVRRAGGGENGGGKGSVAADHEATGETPRRNTARCEDVIACACGASVSTTISIGK